jgi:predicted O-linked N-acetylglucosamine transferase (SPINDLY family)
MATEILAAGTLQAMVHNLSVADLIRSAETLKQSGQINSVETLYAAWVRHHPEDPLLYAVLFNYSVVLSDSGKLQEARECLEKAIALNAEFMPAYINLGRVYERMGSASLAVVEWSAALAHMAAVTGNAITYKTTALNQSARALEAANQDEPAENLLRQSLELDCQQREAIQHLVALRQRQCEWPVVLPSERVPRRALMEAMSPLSAAGYADDPFYQLALAHRYNKDDAGTPEGSMTEWPIAAAHTGPLRVGYLSSDLREHAVGYLMAEVFGLHDRSAVEVFAYYCGPEAHDELHQRFQREADHWVSLTGMDDAAAAQRIAADGVQILVDLNGYTREARLKLLARRPAPVIVNWLGYPGTMASPYHRYIIADDWVIPPDYELYYSEKVLRLPCYQPNNRFRSVAPGPVSRAQAGLPEEGMVYCCFNGAHKLTRFTLERWLDILAAVPGSVLWLLDSSPVTNQRLQQFAEARGLDPQRLVFAGKAANAHHLARYPLADLFLDTMPYGAHTTASDALYMGVPVLTWSGRSFASRVCGSLVRAAGMPEMVCQSGEEFVERAVAFGRDPASLAPLREHLRAARNECSLFDTPALVRGLEGLYREMWGDFEGGTLPRPDLANLDTYLEVGSQADHEAADIHDVPDYDAWWRARLAARDQFRPIEPDRRLASGLNTAP